MCSWALPQAIPPSQLWKESLYGLLVSGLGACSKGVLKQPQTYQPKLYSNFTYLTGDSPFMKNYEIQDTMLPINGAPVPFGPTKKTLISWTF